MSKLLVLLGIACILSINCAFCNPNSMGSVVFLAAKNSYKSGEYDEALKGCDAAIKLGLSDTHLSAAHIVKANCLRKMKQYDMALDEASKAIAIETKWRKAIDSNCGGQGSKPTSALSCRAQINTEAGKFLAALVDYNEALADPYMSKTPDLQAELLIGKANAELLLRSYKESANDYSRAAQISKDTEKKSRANAGLKQAMALKNGPTSGNSLVHQASQQIIVGTSNSIGLKKGSSTSADESSWLKIGSGLGKQYCLFFATENYTGGWPHLNNPYKDCSDIANELQMHFGFEKPEIVKDATLLQISQKLGEYQKRYFKDNDELFIYFSGHGDFDELKNKAYLVTADSTYSDRNNFRPRYISAPDLLTDITAIKCKRILVCLDTCNSSDFFKFMRDNYEGPATKGDTAYPSSMNVNEIISATSSYCTRRLLTSSKAAALDGRRGENSPFALALLGKLRTYGGTDGFLLLPDLEKAVETKTTGTLGSFTKDQPGSQFFFLYKKQGLP